MPPSGAGPSFHAGITNGLQYDGVESSPVYEALLVLHGVRYRDVRAGSGPHHLHDAASGIHRDGGNIFHWPFGVTLHQWPTSTPEIFLLLRMTLDLVISKR